MPHFVSEFLSVNDKDGGENRAAVCCRDPSRYADVYLGGTPVAGCSFLWREGERIITGPRLSVSGVGEALPVSTLLTWLPFVCTLQCLLPPFWSYPPNTCIETEKRKHLFSLFLITIHSSLYYFY